MRPRLQKIKAATDGHRWQGNTKEQLAMMMSRGHEMTPRALTTAPASTFKQLPQHMQLFLRLRNRGVCQLTAPEIKDIHLLQSTEAVEMEFTSEGMRRQMQERWCCSNTSRKSQVCASAARVSEEMHDDRATYKFGVFLLPTTQQPCIVVPGDADGHHGCLHPPTCSRWYYLQLTAAACLSAC